MREVQRGELGEKGFGLALDMGTTLVCAGVIDLDKGKEIARAIQLNGQIAFADNIISRINFALRNKEGLRKLNRAVIATINRVIKEVLERAGVKEKEILRLIAVGNTLMHHLLLSIMPTTLITPPYRPATMEPVETQTKALGISLDKDTPIRILPNLGGFVGSDCLGVILAGGIFRSRRIKLAVDLGTNGNIILGSKERILVTSTAAGGAFEGRHISCGMRAEQGAIEGVRLKEGEVNLRVIGNKGARGICGSGLIDAISEMLKVALIDRKGNMKKKDFILYQDNQRVVKIIRRDVREMQLAKASIYAGIKILEKELGINTSDISEILLSGAFGNKVRKESVTEIGLIPKINGKKIKFIGNGALKGAEMALASEEEYSRALTIRERVRHVPLGGRKDFAREFAKAMEF